MKHFMSWSLGKRYRKTWGPGYRFFKCQNGHEFKEKSRDWTSPTDSGCSLCGYAAHYIGGEPHYEWRTDKFGNLLDKD